MKKIILILVIFAVLLFSGCDAMLEVFYPEFADDFDGNNVLWVDAYFSQFQIDILDNYPNNPVRFEIYTDIQAPGSDNPVAYTNVSVSAISSLTTIGKEFFLADGSYQIFIWQDNNGVGLTGGDNDVYLNPIQNVTLVGSDEYEYVYASTWAQN